MTGSTVRPMQRTNGMRTADRHLLRNVMLAGWLVLALVYACDREPSSWLPYRQGDPAAIQCRAQDDCTLLPAVLNCCGECDPVPPFEAVPSTEVDALLIELETRCAEKPRLCEPLSCEVAPPGCEAYATCVRGRCEVVQSGSCGPLVVTATL